MGKQGRLTALRYIVSAAWFAFGMICLLGGLWPASANAANVDDAQIRVTLSKDSLLLGVQQSLDMTMHLPRNRKLQKFNFQALLGSVSNVEVTPNGRKVHATYTPPEQFFPSVDLVVVSASDGATTFWGFTTVKLIGQGKAKIETVPEATTYLRIGAKKFGPVTADSNGEAFVDVQVPPGVTHGIDDEGNEVPLHLPQGPRAAIFAARGPQINLDETKRDDLLLVFWTPEGTADKAVEAPSVEAESGILSAPEQISKGVFRLSYDVPETPGIVNFTIYDDTGQQVRSQSIELVGTKDFKETAVTIKEDFKEKKPQKAPVPLKPVTPLPPIGEYRLFLTGLGGVVSNFTTWTVGTGKLGVAYRLPAKPIIGIGIQAGFEYDSAKTDVDSDKTRYIKTLVMPVTAVFYYRIPIVKGWYFTPGAELGVKLVARIKDELTRNDGIDTRPAFTGGVNVAFERVLGPGLLVFQVDASYLKSNLRLFRGQTMLVGFLAGYRIAIGKPKLKIATPK